MAMSDGGEMARFYPAGGALAAAAGFIRRFLKGVSVFGLIWPNVLY